LGIVYSSQSGNDILGYGWHLSGLSAISRVNKNPYYDNTTAPVTLTSSDDLILDGQRLISIGTNSYSPENDPYTIVQFQTGNYITVTTKDGMVMEYGNDNSISNHSKFILKSSTTVYIWSLDKMTDPNGNYIAYTYTGDNTTGEYEISRIDYTGNNGTAPYNYVSFSYGTRTDINTMYVAGYAMNQTKLLNSVKVYAEGTLAYDYEFTYYYDGQYTKLNQVGLTANGAKFNPTIINWGSIPNFTQNKTTDLGKIAPLYFNGNNFRHLYGDINNDGLQDIVEIIPDTYYPVIIVELMQQDGTYQSIGTRQLISTGNDHYTAIGAQVVNWNKDVNSDILVDYFYYKTDSNGNPISSSFLNQVYQYTYDGNSLNLNPSPVYSDPADDISDIYQFYYGDFDNDGQIDRIVVKNNNIYDITIDGKDLTSSTLYNCDIHFNDIRMLDFDGDGQTEILILNNTGYGEIYKYNGSDFDLIYGSVGTFFGLPKNIFFGDLNGDRKTDYICYNNGSWNTYYSTGTGFIAGPNMPSIGSHDPATTASYLLLVDMNHDGKDDLVYGYNNTFDIYLSQGVSFSTSVATINPIASLKDTTLYPTGMNCINLFSVPDANGQNQIMYIDNVNCKFLLTSFTSLLDNNLRLSSITNGNNLTSSINYCVYHDYTSPELSFPLRVFRWPMLLANKIKSYVYMVSNNFSDVFYTFSNGKMNMQGKGFLGFMNVSSTDLISNTSTVNTYSTDVYLYPNLFYTWLKTSTKSRNSIMVSYTTNSVLNAYVPHPPCTDKFFYPFSYTNTTTDELTGLTNTNTIINFQTSIGRITDQKSVTSDGWTTETKTTYTPISGNINKPSQVITTRTLGSDSYQSKSNFTYESAYPYRLLTQKFQDKITTDYTNNYDPYSNIKGSTVSVTDGTPSRGTSCLYDNYGRFIISSTDVAGLTSTATFRSSDGAVLTQTDPNSLITSYSYSSGGNALVSTATLPDGNKVTNIIGWYATGNDLYYSQKSVTNGNTVTSYFNAVGWKLSEASTGYKCANMPTSYSYNADGTVNSETYPGISTSTTYTYYPEGRLKTKKGLNLDIQYSYLNNTVTTTDNILSQTSTQTFDGLGNVTQVSATTGNIAYSYFASGKVKQITTGGSSTSMTYDPLTLDQLSLSDPNAGTTNYTYNGFGQLKTQIDAKLQTTTCSYYDNGRLNTKSGGGSTSTYVYFTTAGKLGLLKSITRDNVSETYDYDALCRTKTITTSGAIIPGGSNNNFITSYQYDATTGRLASTTYPSGLTLNYIYDCAGNLTVINNGANGSKIWAGDAKTTAGLWSNFSLGNGISTYYYYNNYQLYSIQTGVYGSIQNLGFTFNSAGQLVKRTDGSLTENFTYDGLDRLATAQASGGTAFTFNYLANGNIDKTTPAGQYHYGASQHPHAVSSIDGPTNSGQSPPLTTTSTYNIENKTLTIDNGTYHDDFTYGVDGNRFRVDLKQSGTLKSSKVFVNNNEFMYNASGSVVYKRTIIYAPTGVCAVYQDSGNVKTFYYIHTDYLGSWLAITDNSGSLKQRYSYDAWGRPRDPTTWKLKVIGTTNPVADLSAMQPRFDRGYTGHEMMAGFALINMNGRLYDPYVQRFLSPDNYVQQPDNSQNFNRYSYCINNPLKYTDPSGNKWRWSYLIPFVGIDIAAADAAKDLYDHPQKAKDLAAFAVNPFKGPALLASAVEAIHNGDLSQMDPTKSGTKINNSNRLYEGLFAADTRKEGWGWQIVSRLTWQLPQTAIGLGYTNFSNIAYDGKQVEFVHGATVLSVRGDITFTYAITFGSYITGEDIFNDPATLRHEYGHYLQSQSSGPLFLLKYGIPSAINNDGWYEADATARGNAYFNGTYKASDFSRTNPSWWEFGLALSPDWYYIPFINLIHEP